MNRIFSTLTLSLFVLSGTSAFATPLHAAHRTPKATKVASKKVVAHKTAHKAASCCTGGACCAACPTCCQEKTCNTGSCPSGCCDMSACTSGAACCQ